MIASVNPPEIWPPFGAFSMAVIQGAGQVVYLKGQLALDKNGRVVGVGDMAAQTRQALENIKSVLAYLGGVMGDIVSLTHHTTDIKRFMETGAVRREYFSEPYPVTTTVQVAALYHPDLMIEITAIAEIPRDRFRRPAT